MTKELEFLIDLVKNASTLIEDNIEINAKGDKGDIVTNYDLAIEKYMIEKMNKYYPNFSIVSEEYNKDESLKENSFIIDPIDGTVNFANGLPLWGIQVACVKDGKPCAAVIYLPRLNELYYADENGSFMNDKKISVNDKSLYNGVFSIEGPNNIVSEFKMRPISRNYRDFHCAAIDFSYVANGRSCGTCFMCDNLWDYMPGLYIAKMAGAKVYDNPGLHIVANSDETLKILLENTKDVQNEKLIIE